MKPPEYRSTLALEVLASSLATRLTVDELEWLSKALAQRSEEKWRKESMTTAVKPRGAENGQLAEAYHLRAGHHGSPPSARSGSIFGDG